ncbi:MAG TPA: Asp-tRNA(Asn)/Glu-tRNA(Gln) amidotransferase subunit GatC [Burkholderiaceae bacterium]|nr:Asp-tRNA(Asn)/Glu-tRNA(Gln) amidotransferase subunit GatC [Burkholderiaceae bacterium]
MSITQEDVSRIAQLAGLELTPAQSESMQSDFSDILSLIRQLQSVDTGDVAPMAHPLCGHQDVTLRLRDDVARPASTPEERDALMANAPATADGLFLVPTVIE